MSEYATVNPATGERIAEFTEATDVEIAAAVDAADAAYRSWRTVPVAERAEVLRAIGALWRKRSDELAPILALEMGKPVKQGAGEIGLCANIFDYYADRGADFLADQELESIGGISALVRTEPIGALLGIMPWNYPFYQVARFAAPNLMLGNTILLKHAPNCPQSALAIAELFAEAGLPDGAYTNLFATHAQVADIIADPRIAGVSVTGSERAGSAIGEIAGRNLKKFVLELGGSDPFLVLDAANLDRTVKAAVGNRVLNGGQMCTASKRFIVVDDVYDDFLAGFSAAMGAVTPADPSEPSTFLGPLSSSAAVDLLTEQVRDAVDKGATVEVGGQPIERPGAWFQPTVLTGVTPAMRAYREELFGPVAVVYRVSSEQEAIDLANESPYGLAGSVYTDDDEQGQRVADALEVGMAWVNGTSRSEAPWPFGGVKRSGVGRELGVLGFNEFANKKLIGTRQRR